MKHFRLIGSLLHFTGFTDSLTAISPFRADLAKCDNDLFDGVGRSTPASVLNLPQQPADDQTRGR